jgi:hypothetical protein
MNNNDLNNTRQYIRLFQMQLHGVLDDMAKPAELLSDQFSDALLNMYSIREHLSEDNQLNRDELSSMIENSISQMFECVSGMQFVDAKRQRIEHVADGLAYLIDIDSNTQTMVDDWSDLKNKIKNQYKMVNERNVYNKYLQEFNDEDEIEYLDVAK